jgi:hypothetical protein
MASAQLRDSQQTQFQSPQAGTLHCRLHQLIGNLIGRLYRVLAIARNDFFRSDSAGDSEPFASLERY